MVPGPGTALQPCVHKTAGVLGPGSVAWLPWYPDSTHGCHVDLSVLIVDSTQQNAPDVTDVKTDLKRNPKFMLKEAGRGTDGVKQ